MPTGYTSGILDGKITTFPQFAKLCMRAFGATIHMRDDDMDAEYTPRTPSDYHKKEIEKAKQLLKEAETLPDETIIANKKIELEERKKYHIDSLKKARICYKSMNCILKDIYKWQPPSLEHNGLKDFMIDQIVKTIDFDCNTDHHDEHIAKIELGLLSLNADEIRKEMEAKAKRDFEYHTREYHADVQKCNQSNQWVADLMDSLSE